ncbi:MAG: tyrosine-type recombinase/integrase [Gammaproteobacteria bacterium]|nr:tyrosine-type recombinase/integrase [Gammaproteobacteria bacterium]
MTAPRLQQPDTAESAESVESVESQDWPVETFPSIGPLQRQVEQEALENYLRQQLAPSTARAYRSDWTVFQEWCRQRGLSPLPAEPETIALFLASQARDGLQISTLERRLAAIRLAHDVAGELLPTSHKLVRGALAGIARHHGRQVRPKTPALAAQVKAMVETIPDSLRGCRDRALLLLGFAGAFRRSELVAIRVEDLLLELDGVRVRLPRSKTDQEGRGAVVPVLRGKQACPVRALNTWLARAEITTGPVFVRFDRAGRIRPDQALSPQTVALIVKWYAFKAGFDPRLYAAHSLRRGFATQAAMNGATPYKLRAVTRQTLATLQQYIDDAEAFVEHAGRDML